MPSRKEQNPTAKLKSPSPDRVIREPDFAQRLAQACDAHSHVPSLHSGRLTWIQRQLAERYDMSVSVETVRKWASGEAKPRPPKMEKLAQLLEVDVAWLSMGAGGSLSDRDRRVMNAMADGVVNVVAGLIQMDGGHVAFPEADDVRAKSDHVDLHAIIKGAKYDLHVSLGEPEGRTIRFAVPTNYAAMVVLGIVRQGFTFEIYELPAELIETGSRRGGSIDVTAKAADMRRIETFTQRL